MSKTQKVDPSLELTGNAVVALISSINCENYIPVLKEFKFEDIDPNSWYSLNTLLQIFDRIAGTGSGMMDLVSIGMAAGERSLLPEQVLALPPQKFLDVYATVYPQRHRGGDPGWMKIEHVDALNSRIISCTPYPDDLWYGLMYGLVKRVVKPDQYFVMRYAARQDKGDPATIIDAVWE